MPFLAIVGEVIAPARVRAQELRRPAAAGDAGRPGEARRPAAEASGTAGMTIRGVLPPGLTLVTAGTYGLPCKRFVDWAGDHLARRLVEVTL